MDKVIQIKNTTKKKKKSHMEWAWILMVGFFILAIVDLRFGILGFVCMGAPLYHAIRGKGKIHCQKYCPRGSLLGRMLESISMQNQMPKWMSSKSFKHGLLVFMLVLFSFSMYHAGLSFTRIAFAMFRFMAVSSIVGILMGVFFKPRSWCVVCPMGHGTVLLDRHVIKPMNEKKQMVAEVQEIEISKETGKRAS